VRRALALLVAALGLASCDPAKPIHDKAYFTAHPQERAKAIAECQNDPGRLGADPSCVNAIHSDADAEHERVFHGVPTRASGVTNANHL